MKTRGEVDGEWSDDPEEQNCRKTVGYVFCDVMPTLATILLLMLTHYKTILTNLSLHFFISYPNYF